VALAVDRRSAVGRERAGAGLSRQRHGGIISWSCENEAVAQQIAAEYCARWDKYHRITACIGNTATSSPSTACGRRTLPATRCRRCGRETPAMTGHGEYLK